jgi:hypothetical protein
MLNINEAKISNKIIFKILISSLGRARFFWAKYDHLRKNQIFLKQTDNTGKPRKHALRPS